MKIGLWNIDHPETGSGIARKEKRFGDIVRYLERADCELLILTEANAALKLTGYSAEFSEVSPFRSSQRYYGEPNLYHQVGIYSRSSLRRLEVSEAVNGLLCEVPWGSRALQVYGKKTVYPCAAVLMKTARPANGYFEWHIAHKDPRWGCTPYRSRPRRRRLIEGKISTQPFFDHSVRPTPATNKDDNNRTSRT